MINCTCQDWQKISKEHSKLFQFSNIYGWTITWLEITKEDHFHKTNKYGIAITYCPFCGRSISDET